MDNKELNSKTLEKELSWLKLVIETRFNLYFEQETSHKDIFEIVPPNLDGDSSVYAEIIKYYNFSFSERLLIALTLAPHIRPRLLDIFFNKKISLNIWCFTRHIFYKFRYYFKFFYRHFFLLNPHIRH